MLQGVGPNVALGRDTAILREILDQTASRVGKELTNQPAVEAELRSVIGTLCYKTGQYLRPKKCSAQRWRFVEKRFDQKVRRRRHR